MTTSKRRYWNNEKYVQDQTYSGDDAKQRAVERAAAMRRKGYKVRVLHEGYYYQVMVRDPDAR